MSDTVRVYGQEAAFVASQITKPAAISGTTPVLWPSASTGYDTRLLGRTTPFIVINASRAANGATFTVTESATTNGTYTAATVSGSMAILSADGIRYCTVKRNLAKPFIRVTATGDNASTDLTASVTIFGID
jgi:hypothetical protein